MGKWLAQEKQICSLLKMGLTFVYVAFLSWKEKTPTHMLKGEISLNRMSDCLLANLIPSFWVRSLWKTTSNPFSFGVFMLKIFPVRILLLLCKQPTQQHPPEVCTARPTCTPSLGYSGFSSSWNSFRTSHDGRKRGERQWSLWIWAPWTLCSCGHVPAKVKDSPKGEVI